MIAFIKHFLFSEKKIKITKFYKKRIFYFVFQKMMVQNSAIWHPKRGSKIISYLADFSRRRRILGVPDLAPHFGTPKNQLSKIIVLQKIQIFYFSKHFLKIDILL